MEDKLRLKSKSYSADLKSDVLLKLRNGGGLTELSTEYGIAVSTLSGWLKRSAKGNLGLELELGRLKKENEALYKILGRITYEQVFLKKRNSR